MPKLATRRSSRTRAEQARLRFFEAVSTFLTAATGAVPAVILIEDLHWADADSIAL